MRGTARSAVIAGVLLGTVGGAVFTYSRLAGAQIGGSQGGFPTVEVTNRVSATVTTDPDTWLAVAGDSSGTRLQAEVANVPGSYIAVGSDTSGSDLTVNLGPAAMALLAGRMCTYGPGGHISVTTSVTDIPGMVGRTGVRVVAHDLAPNVTSVNCWPGLPDGGQSPNCTTGTGGVGVPISDFGAAAFDVSNSYIIRCVTCTQGLGPGTAVVSGENSQCTP